MHIHILTTVVRFLPFLGWHYSNEDSDVFMIQSSRLSFTFIELIERSTLQACLTIISMEVRTDGKRDGNIRIVFGILVRGFFIKLLLD